jgi:uncharacterized phage infection (PIP) family protein YhgE
MTPEDTTAIIDAEEEKPIPHGAQHLAKCYDMRKAMASHMDDAEPLLDNDNVKSWHGKSRKSLDAEMEGIKSCFTKAYPDITGLTDDEEEENEEEKEKPAATEESSAEEEKPKKKPDMEEKSARLRHGKAGTAPVTKSAPVPAGAIPTVKSASDFLTDLAQQPNLTSMQKAAILHTAGQLEGACAAPDDEEEDPEQVALLKALVTRTAAQVQERQKILNEALAGN